MKKFLTFLLLNSLLPLLLFGTTIESTYKITFGIFGTLGYATTSLNKSDNTYSIKMEAKSIGLAKVLSGNRVEVYESKGKIIDGILVPDMYKKTKMNNRYVKIKKFTFDHINKKVYLDRKKEYKKEKKPESSNELYTFYATNDILTLYFNILELIKTSDSSSFVFNAIGGKKDNGRIDVQKVFGDEKDKINKLLKIEDSTLLKVIINQKIFSSKRGELFISVSDDNLCSIALLKDVILFGDIKGTKVDSID